MVEDQTGAFNVDIVDVVGTTNLEKTELNFRRFGLSNLCTQKWISAVRLQRDSSFEGTFSLLLLQI